MAKNKKPENYDSYILNNETYTAFSDSAIKKDNLPNGIYNPYTDMFGNKHFESIDLKMDEILDLPDTNMKSLLKHINDFWASDMSAKYASYGLIQKLGILLYGKPGTGKTCLIARLSKEFIEKFNAVVLFNPDVSSLGSYVKTIRQIEKDKKIVIIWEEFDSIVNQDEAELLCLLDGEIQAENIVYLATTNYISDIPARIKNRPSRFSIVQEISLPSKDTRHSYFNHKLKTKEDKDKYLGAFVDASEGFTIDQCKDLIVSTLLFNLSIPEAVMKLKSMERDHDMGQDDYNEELKKEIFQTKKSKDSKPIKGLR